LAGLFSAYAIVVALLHGSLVLTDKKLNVFAVVSCYLAGGAAAGSIAGLLRPLNKTMLGRALIGIAAGAPVSMSVIVLLAGPPTVWRVPEWISVAVCTFVIGPFWALYVFPGE
jgi:hypothetical protein